MSTANVTPELPKDDEAALVLASAFVRCATRGQTWHLPRRFAGYQAVSHEQLSFRGAAPKFILRSVGQPNDWYIVKSAEKWGSVETYTELLNNIIGRELGFPMAHAGIIRADGELCFASHNFQRPDETLIHGSLLFRQVFDDDLDGVGKKTWDEQQSQREGIALAKLRVGAYVGRKHSLNAAKAKELRRRVASGESKTAIALEFGIARQTLYRYVAGEGK